ncbi:MAG: hypothetical protein QXL89_01400 [Nitrososphaeria archaeon]
MSGSNRFLGLLFLMIGVFGVLCSFYLFGLKAVTSPLVRHMIGNIIWSVAVSNMTVYEGIEAMNGWLNELSLLSDKPLLLFLIYSLILILVSIMIIKGYDINGQKGGGIRSTHSLKNISLINFGGKYPM